MANMSSQDIQPSMAMLILSRAIYAKKSDDAFYPGTIETKLADGSYLVKFTDGASERVEEHAITWLGFWGLPPWTWPRNPVVQTAGPANMDFLNEHGNKDAISDSLPFKTLFRESNDNSKRVNGFSEMDIKSNVPYRTEKMNQHTHELNSFEQSSAHVLPRQTSENQTRLSVLRMCCDGNLEQEHFKGEKDLLASTEHKLESPAFRPSPHSTSPKNEDKKHFTFDEDYKTLKIKNDSSFRKRKVSSSEYEECSIKDKYTRSEDIENKHRNSPPFQKHYPSTLPSTLLSSQFQNYGHSFGISMYDSPSPPMPASFRLQPRERRRSENKKCRKVYGIENRDIWCTQCKWKKACTRFTGTEKVDRPGLMYMTDYEGLHYPV